MSVQEAAVAASQREDHAEPVDRPSTSAHPTSAHACRRTSLGVALVSSGLGKPNRNHGNPDRSRHHVSDADCILQGTSNSPEIPTQRIRQSRSSVETTVDRRGRNRTPFSATLRQRSTNELHAFLFSNTSSRGKAA